MQALLCTIVMIAVAASPLAAQAGTAVMVPVHQFVDAFKGRQDNRHGGVLRRDVDHRRVSAARRHGAGACAAWMRDYDADAKRNSIAGGLVTLGRRRHLDVRRDRAYVVIPSSCTYARQGKPMKESVSAFTFAPWKMPAGWRITGWSWAKN